MTHYLFIDESEIRGKGITALGGLLISFEEYEQQKTNLRSIKSRHLGDPFAPVKWSPDRSSETFLLMRELHSQVDMRNEILLSLGDSSAKLIVILIQDRNTRFDAQFRLRYHKTALCLLMTRIQIEMGSSGSVTPISELPGTGMESHVCQYYQHLLTYGYANPAYKIEFSRFDHNFLMSHDFMCEGLQMVDMLLGATCGAVKSNGFYYLSRFHQIIRRHPSRGTTKGCGIILDPSYFSAADTVCRFCDTTPPGAYIERD